MPDHPPREPRNAESPAEPRRVAVVTSGRADYGLLRPVLLALEGSPHATPTVIATGAHLSEAHGGTIDRIRADGWDAIETVETETGETGHGSALASRIARGVAGFGARFSETRPDVCLLLGDRFETLAAAVAASSSGVLIAHIHGGEITTGAIDNQFRYAITALANLHCVATAKARDRLVAMGESPEAVIRTGAPGLDALAAFAPMPRDAFCAQAGLARDEPFLLVTLHPETIGGESGRAIEDAVDHAASLVRAIGSVGMPCLVTAANQDPAGDAINAALQQACAQHAWVFSLGLGVDVYHQAMHHADAMVGNSSSGIIEAASFGLPVVNIGERQGGRERSGNVVDCAHDADAMEQAIRDAIAMDRGAITNVYAVPDDGSNLSASERIARAIAAMPLGMVGQRKLFEPPGLGASE